MKEDVYKRLMEYMEGTKDFFLEQSPEVIKEILLLGKVSFSFFFVLFLTSIVLFFVLKRALKKYSDENDVNCDGEMIFTLLPYSIIPIVLLAVTVKQSKVFVTPKLYVIEQVSKRVGK